MIRWILPLIFVFSSSNSWGRWSERYKRLWTETGYNFDWFLNRNLNSKRCLESEKQFSACMMSFHKLVSLAIENEPYQLVVSGSNLEIVPWPEKNKKLKIHNTEQYNQYLEQRLKSNNKRRESFRLYFRTMKRNATSA